MSRIARVCAINYPHHITQRGNNQEQVFFDIEDKDFYLKTLKKYCARYELEIWAYCLMPNHVHILTVPKKETSLARGLGGINLVYTQYVNRKYNRTGRLWQNRFYSTPIDKDAYLWNVTRYIERNPVRARLVNLPDKYRWSSAKSHATGVVDSVLSPSDWLKDIDLKTYRDFLLAGNDEADSQVRLSTSTGRPFGSDMFIKHLEKILGRDLIAKKVGRPRNNEK
ncbi:MAG: transposase [Deltaproteobacteria bacterium]|nr:transposase [Deltaproteobacteria bacterium]